MKDFFIWLWLRTTCRPHRFVWQHNFRCMLVTYRGTRRETYRSLWRCERCGKNVVHWEPSP